MPQSNLHLPLPRRRVNRRASASRPLASRELRRLRRRREERGIILVFVVVLLSLLAIMGTAYLAVSRADRATITAKTQLPGTANPMLQDRTRLDQIFGGMQTRVQQEIIADLFNMQPGVLLGYQDSSKLTPNARGALVAAFRQSGYPVPSSVAMTRNPGFALDEWYKNYDAPGVSDPYLASLLPVKSEPYVDSASGDTEDPSTPNLVPQRPSLAALNQPANPLRIRWPWISSPLQGERLTIDSGDPTFGAGYARMLLPGVAVDDFFSDPRSVTVAGGFTRVWAPATNNNGWPRPVQRQQVADVLIRSVEMLREDKKTPAGDNTRVYPGLLPVTSPVAVPFIAGDADGDGIADCGLSPVVLDPSVALNSATAINRYLDKTNNVVYLVGYRVVDNSARLNLTTALTHQGDFEGAHVFAVKKDSSDTQTLNYINNHNTISDQPNGVIPPDQPAINDGELRNVLPYEYQPGVGYANAPNRGFFGGNTGLVELLREQMRPFANLAPNAKPVGADFLALPGNRGLREFFDLRFPLITQTPGGTQSPNDAYANSFAQIIENGTTYAGLNHAEFRVGDRYAEDGSLTNLDFNYRSFQDLLQQTLVRRPTKQAPVLWYDYDASNGGTTPTLNSLGFRWLPASDAVSLASRGGSLLNDRITPSMAESGLTLALQMSAPNFNAGGSEHWSYFPPTQRGVQLWYSWTQDFEQYFISPPNGAPIPPQTLNTIDLLDGNYDPNRNGTSTPPASPANDPYRAFSFTAANPGEVSSRLPKSIRSLVTTYSGVTNNAPRRYDPTSTSGLPAGMPVYDANTLGYDVYPATRVSAATGTKEQLWRAYWSAMTHTVDLGNGVLDWDVDAYTSPSGITQNGYTAFLTPDRHPTQQLPVGTSYTAGTTYYHMTEKQMALIRSAVAACNTIDARDNDDDITAMTVNLGYDEFQPVGQQVTTAAHPLFARVYGAERQLVISSVVIDRPPPGATGTGPGNVEEMYVELFNPSDRPIDLRGYRLGVVERSENTTGTGVTLADGRVSVSPALTQMIELCAQDAPTDDPHRFLLPGGFLIVYTGSTITPGLGPTDIDVPAEQGVGTPLALGQHQVMYRVDDPASNLPTQPLLDGLVQGSAQNRELVLVRTRRADGEQTTENQTLLSTPGITNPFPRPGFSEDKTDEPTNVATLLTLVPMDAVDFRSLDFDIASEQNNKSGQRYVYQRQVNAFTFRDPTPNNKAWRAFYAGHGYVSRPYTIPDTTKPYIHQYEIPDPKTKPQDGTSWAWRSFPSRITGPDGAYASPGLPNDRFVHVALGEGAGVVRADVNTIATGDIPPVYSKPPSATQFPPETPASEMRPFFAPTIPIQNFTPTTNFYLLHAGATAPPALPIDYSPNVFPYGSPFARDGDVLTVPYIGSYKIYRFPRGWNAGTNVDYTTPAGASGGVPAATDAVLYEYVPLPMDAVAVSPLMPVDTANLGTTTYRMDPENPSVGRFDAREKLSSLTGTDVDPLMTNLWADDLFDYVTARDTSARRASPDVPTVADSVYNNPIVPLSDQDGPINGANGANGPVPRNHAYTAKPDDPVFPYEGDPAEEMSWVRWTNLKTNAPSGSSRAPDYERGPIYTSSDIFSITHDEALRQGVINLNTAPPVVQRMLPLTVNGGNGRLEVRPYDPANPIGSSVPVAIGGTDGVVDEQRHRAVAVETLYRDARNLGTDPAKITSLFAFNSVDPMPGNLNAFSSTTPPLSVPTAPPSPTPFDQAMQNLGDLQPYYRPDPQQDFQALNRDMTRISNLASTRSDVFTVYITVQAWTWTGDANQASDTRLVGERRGAFIVDRSRIQPIIDPATGLVSGYQPKDLVILPVDQD